MDREALMSAAARNAMVHALELSATDSVLVVSDQITRTCAAAFVRGAESLGCSVQTYRLPEENRPLTEMPPGMLAHLAGKSVVINAIDGDSREVPFRLQWIKAIENTRRVRMGHSPGIDEEMMIAGSLNVNYATMQENADKLIAALADTNRLHITAAAGTDLELSVAGRSFIDDLRATVEFGVNLPCGEIYCAPIETAAEGIVVVDSCMGSHGTVPSPVTMTITGGRVVDVACADERIVTLINGWLDTDEQARNIAELGIGLNPGARLTSRMLEAEKALGTAHIAFGSNEGFPGGQGRSQMHVDYLFHSPTMVATFTNGTAATVITDGVFEIN